MTSSRGSAARRVARRRSPPEAVRDFRNEVLKWADRLGIRPRQVRVQRMTRKWGSCSAIGTVSFAEELLRERAEFRNYVIVHELLHLRVRNHGALFRSYLGAYVPGWRHHQRRAAGEPAGQRGAKLHLRA